MTPNRTLAVALAFAGIAACATAAEPMDDLEIAHTAYTAGQLDIRYAHLALALSEDESVRGFSETMIRDHSAVNRAAGDLIAELKVAPKDNALSQALVTGALVTGAAEKRERFTTLRGKAFDCAYAANELAYHQLVNKTVADAFIPNVTVQPLKALLADALVTFRQHEQHAAAMVAGLGCA